MQQRRWLKLFSDYDCEIRYYPGKANVVADALIRKERVKPKRIRAMNMTLQSKLFSDYDCEIRYHLGKANVVADALSRKERVNPRRVRAMNMTLQSSIKDRILTAQKEAMDEPVKAEHQRPSGLLQQPEILRSYADKRRKPLEFSLGDYVLLKVSPWKGVVRFGKKAKLAPRFVRPFVIIKKGGAVVLTRWIDKMENVQKMSGCSINQKVKYNAGSFVGKALTWRNSQICVLSWEVVNLLPTILAQVGNKRNVRNQNGNVVNENVQENVGNMKIKRYVYGLAPQIRRIVAATEPKSIQKAVQISGALTDEAVRNGSTKKDCRGVLRNVNSVNARNPTVRTCYECGSTDHVRSACLILNREQRPGGNHPNQVATNNGVQDRGNQRNLARGKAFMLGAEEARQDLNIMTGIEPDKLGFKYEIEIASG
nr:reverse transcriptase domain-containing protein [Tanacetum cinerariifolium]